MATGKQQATTSAKSSGVEVNGKGEPTVYLHPDSEMMIFVEAKDALELEREHEILSKLLERRMNAGLHLEQLTAECIDQSAPARSHEMKLKPAYKELDDACLALRDALGILTPLKDNPTLLLDDNAKKSAVGITELITVNKGYKGYKYTYVRSDKVSNHRRRYKLNQGEVKSGAKSFFKDVKFIDKDGQERVRKEIDVKKLKSQIDKIKPTMKLWEMKILDDNSGVWGEWAEDLNNSLRNSPYKGEMIEFDSQAQLMRWAYGAGIRITASPAELSSKGIAFKPNSAGKASMYASFALAESRTKGTLYLPDRNGWTIEYPHKNGGRGSLGTILFELTLSLSGSLGASLAIEAGVNLNGNSIKGVPAKSGEGSEGGPGRRKMDITKAIDDSDIAGELSVFVGIEYGVNLSGALKWRNPEKPKDFAVLAKVGAGVTVQAGAGASGMITFTFKGGTVRTMVKGGLCWGGGGKGVASFEIDVEKIASEFLPCFTYMLRNMDYEKLTKIVLESDYYAFCMLPILLLNGVKFGVEIENITESLISSWESKEQRVTLMDKINDSDGDCLKYSPPETKGAVIAALIETNFWDTLSLSSNQMQPCDGPGAIMSARKLAILYTLKWVQSQRDYENVMQHLDKIPGAKVKGDWEKNQQQVLAFLAKGEEARIYPYVGLVQASHYAEKLAQIYASLPTANNIDPDIPLQPVNSVLLSSCSKLVYQQHNKNNGAMLA